MMRSLLLLLLTETVWSTWTDPQALQWKKLGDGPFSAREGLMAVQTPDAGVLMTGGRDHFGAAAVADVWANNGTHWTERPKPPWKPRAYHAMMRMNDCVYVMGGQKVAFLGNPFYNDVWRSCDNGESWTSLGNAPWETRAGIAFTVFEGKMIIAGGCYHSSIGKSRLFLNDVWASGDGKNWEQLTPNASWSARSGARLVVYNGQMLLVAGEVGFTPDTQLGDLWSSKDGKDWTLVTSSPGFVPRSGHGVFVANSAVYVLAGWSNNKCIHDLWRSTDGVAFEMLSNHTWDCDADDCGKFDFWTVQPTTDSIMTIGGSNAYATFGKMWADTWSLSGLTSMSRGV